MIKRTRTVAGASIVMLVCGTLWADGVPRPENAKARISYDLGVVAREAGDNATASREFRLVISTEPDFLTVQINYVDAVYAARPDTGKSRLRASGQLVRDYQEWSKQFPASWGVQFGWGYALDRIDKKLAKPHYEQALKLNSHIVEAYMELAMIAQVQGDFPGCREMYRRVLELQPTNGAAALDLSNCIQPMGTEDYHQYLLTLEKDFAGTDWALWALQVMSTGMSQTEGIGLLTRVRHQYRAYARAGSKAYDNMMMSLFHEYMQVDTQSALVLAADMSHLRPASSAWKNALAFCHIVTAVHRLLSEGRTAAAVAIAGAARPPSSQEMSPLLLLRSQAALVALGPTAAYEAMLPAVAWYPAATLRAQIAKLSTRLGKCPSAVDKDIYRALAKRAKPFAEFSLEGVESRSKSRLSFYRGKIVLVSFWAPSCGPCRAEFSRIEKILEAFPNDVVVVAVNTRPEQDSEVLPFLKRNSLRFTALRVPSGKWAHEKYGVSILPANILLDAEGREIARPFARNDQEQEMLEYQIRVLTNRGVRPTSYRVQQGEGDQK
jgi:thiol-disulfide isomerase/thioredoxin